MTAGIGQKNSKKTIVFYKSLTISLEAAPNLVDMLKFMNYLGNSD